MCRINNKPTPEGVRGEQNQNVIMKQTKLISLLFAIVASISAIFAESGTCGARLTWNLSNGVLTISGTGDMYDYSMSSPSWDSYSSSINSVVIENGVTRIGAFAFNYYTSLQDVTISNTVTSIGKCAFANTSIYSIDIPNSVREIGNASFQSCSQLTTVIIGSGVTSISNYAFSSCSAIRNFTCKATYPPVCYSFCFNGVNKAIPLYVPAGSVGYYSQADEWKEFYNIQEINTEALNNITTEGLRNKVLRNGNVYIHNGDKTYTLQGQEVE